MFVILSKRTKLEWDTLLESWERRGMVFNTREEADYAANRAGLKDYTIYQVYY